MVRDCKLPHGGHAKFTCLYEKDTVALPRLVEQGKRIQFCFIDGLHTFDYTMLDAFYADQAQPPTTPTPSHLQLSPSPAPLTPSHSRHMLAITQPPTLPIE